MNIRFSIRITMPLTPMGEVSEWNVRRLEKLHKRYGEWQVDVMVLDKEMVIYVGAAVRNQYRVVSYDDIIHQARYSKFKATDVSELWLA